MSGKMFEKCLKNIEKIWKCLMLKSKENLKNLFRGSWKMLKNVRNFEK